MPNVLKWIDEVLRFWFEETRPEAWFARDELVDAAIRKRFGALHASLTEKVPAAATVTPNGALATVIVLDQFSRNLFRNSPRAFACDQTALSITQDALRSGFDREFDVNHRTFLYMPLQHSESREVQRQSVELYRALGNATVLEFAIQHRDIIERFGRFPHRNRVLGRESTPEEIAFLKTHSGF